MRKNRLKLRKCGKMLLIVILLTFLKNPVFAEPLTQPPPNLNENETRLYTDSEIDLLIDEISEAAIQAIEQAAAEAARAAALASLEREAMAIREAQKWRIEAEINLQAITEAKKAGRKNAVIAGLVCFLGGLVFGVGGTLIIGGK